MSSSQHRDVGRNYHALAMRLISEGHPEAAGELLWGAMDRITKAVAEHHGLTRQGTGQPLRRKDVVAWMDSHAPASTTTTLASRFDVVARLHGHFYNGHLSPQAHGQYLQQALTFISDLLNHPQTQQIL